MRLSIKGALTVVGLVVVFGTTLLLSQCKSSANYASNKDNHQPSQQHMMPENQAASVNEENEEEYPEAVFKSKQLKSNFQKMEQDDSGQVEFTEITCNINEETSIPCRRDKSEVFIPFSFIHKYFEIYGQITEDENQGVFFQWSHSNSRIFEPSEPYDPFGTFLNFAFFNVEARDRVLCISAQEGVPISTQWLPSGYTYPTQIAQFGLSHYSKYINEGKTQRIVLEDGSKVVSNWVPSDHLSSFKRIFDEELRKQVLRFKTTAFPSHSGLNLDLRDLDTNDMLVISMKLRMSCETNSSITITVETRDRKSQTYYIHYTCVDDYVKIEDHDIYYGIGDKSEWTRFTRNLAVDFQKGIASGTSKKMRKRLAKTKINLVSMILRGKGMIGELQLAKAEHLNHVYDAADWLVKHQDRKGGWAVPVPRKMVAGIMEAPAGWYSAMGQGQAISLFVRAYHLSRDRRYLEAAVKATHLYSVNTTNGGVRTYFPGGYVWYEEYPTRPSSFVLNGYIYSLFGLYDLTQVPEAPPSNSKPLFDDGMHSLKTLLPFYDSGSGSFYDLRHFTTHLPPKIARWDYHTTHITQLLILASIDDDPDGNLLTTAERWKDYTFGRRATHN